MKYLIAGLGNIGEEYAHTRHNIGFNVVEALADALEAEWSTEKLGDRARGKYKGRQLVLLKPSTYMNRSGKAIRYWLEQEGIDRDRLLVIVDDLNIDFGKLRIRAKGSDGGHNGLRDVQQQLGTTKYPRLRVGIGSDFSRGQQVDFVLGKWREEEQEQLRQVIDRAVKAAQSFVFAGLSNTMNTFNG